MYARNALGSKTGNVSPDSLFLDKSSSNRRWIVEIDFGISPEKLFPDNISSIIPLALPIFSGSFPEKLFLDRASTDRLCDSKRRGGREPESLLSERTMEPRSISASHRGKVPSSSFSLKSRKFRPFCKEIHSGISPTSPQDFNDSRESMHFGSTLSMLLFQVIELPPINKSTSPFISNNHIGTCPPSQVG